MSARSIYLRDQAANREWHAKNIRDDETEVALREMAARYVAEADDIEIKERVAHILGSDCRSEPGEIVIGGRLIMVCRISPTIAR